MRRAIGVRWLDWRSAVTVKVAAWVSSLWVLYGIFVFFRDEVVSSQWQERLTLGVLLPSVSVWTWIVVLLVALLVLSVEGIHKLSDDARAEQKTQGDKLPLGFFKGSFRIWQASDDPIKFYLVVDDAAVTNSTNSDVSLRAFVRMRTGDISWFRRAAKYKPLQPSALEGLRLESRYQLPQVIDLRANSSSRLGYWAFVMDEDAAFVLGEAPERVNEREIWIVFENLATKQTAQFPITITAWSVDVQKGLKKT